MLGRFPTENLAFILIAGFYTVISFPFNFFSTDFTDVTRLTIPDIGLYGLHELSTATFAPFINIKYLGYPFPAGLLQLLLLGLLPGFVIFLLYTVYEWLNGLPAILLSHLRKSNKKPPESIVKTWVAGKRLNLDIQETLNFYKWLRGKRIDRYFVFLTSICSSSEGLLFGNETFVVVLLAYLYFSHGMASQIYEWIVLGVLLTIMFYFIYLASLRKSRKDMCRFYATYRAEQASTTPTQ